MATAVAVLVAAQPALADDARESRNVAKSGERWAHEQADAEYQLALRRRNVAALRERNGILLRDPERNPTTLCSSHFDGCAGDPRMYDFAGRHGVSTPIGFTNRYGAHVSGHVWAPFRRAGEPPRSLPAVAIVTGSIQPTEQMYWHAAQVIAQRGYVVLTFDVQGQGRSDAFGAEEDRMRGVPAAQQANFDRAAEEALDFLLSTPDEPYVPRRQDGSPAGDGDSTPAQQKHARRVAEGLAHAHNPLAERVDRDRVGLVGHSLGATAASVVGQRDPRVDSIVAWSNLVAPAGVPIAKPALGIAGDYGLVAKPHGSPPDPQGRNEAFLAFRERAPGVDVMQIAIRGGTHWESTYIPNPAFAATLRGIDLVDWYTTAWLDRYVKGDPHAVRRLLSDRWRADARAAEVDLDGDGNAFSYHYRSRLAIGRGDGTVVACDDLRAGCPALVPRAADGHAGEWSYLEAREAP